MPKAASSSTVLPELGVGLVYSSAVEPILHEFPGLVPVLEIEPQTMWIQESARPGEFREPRGLLEHLASLPGRKLIHSVSVPVGGSAPPATGQLPLLNRWAKELDSPWVSEHLSFNATVEFQTGFFLAPRQTWEGVEMVAQGVRRLAAAMPVPVAIETGVNYLHPRNEELKDGDFVREVVARTECGILLDLHNVYTNALNGRQSVDDFLSRIPLDRVWEVHLAGGSEMDGFWLDGHSGPVPEHLLEISRRVLGSMPNLKAMIFEIYRSYIPLVGLDAVRGELEKLHELWAGRQRPRGDGVFTMPADGGNGPKMDGAGIPSPRDWEESLGQLVIGRTGGDSPLSRELAADRGVKVMRSLVNEFRASMLVNVLRLTMRFLMLSLGEEALRTLMQEFWKRTAPQFYGATEAEKFAAYLRELQLRVPRLADVLEFECALLATALDDQPRVVRFEVDPLPLLRALADGRLPEVIGQVGTFELEIVPDQMEAAENLSPENLGFGSRSH